jgi:hypothetical protein
MTRPPHPRPESAPAAQKKLHRVSDFFNTIGLEKTLGALMIERLAAKISPLMCDF